jgi:hypothetical protein
MSDPAAECGLWGLTLAPMRLARQRQDCPYWGTADATHGMRSGAMRMSPMRSLSMTSREPDVADRL